jgi:hypothetical protein
MTPSMRIVLAAALSTFCFQLGHAQSQFEEELAFCKTITTKMPDPRAPSFYTALPTRNGAASGAGWSGHVKAWFNFMRDSNSGAMKQYLVHDAELTRAATEYRQAVIDRGSELLAESGKSTFKNSVKNLNLKTNGQVDNLVSQYVNESREVQNAYGDLRRALIDVQEAKAGLESVRNEYEAFLNEMKHRELQEEKQTLLDEAADIQALLSSTIGSLSNVTSAIPFDGISIMKGISGEPVSSIIKLAFGPDPTKLAELDAKLLNLDTKIKEHRDRGFTEKIKAARLKFERSESVPESSANKILDHKLKSWQAVQALAGLEREDQGFQFFHKLRDYYKAVAFKASALNEAVNNYYRFLTKGRPAEGEILQTRIEADLSHVDRHKLEPSGEWAKLATSASSWLNDRYLPWYRPEVQHVGGCLKGFKELRHLRPVDNSINRVVEATEGIPQSNLGKYLL